MAAAPAPAFRYLGITDDVLVCQQCGKDELKKTVVLETLGADGNAEDTLYFGSTCAARALTARTGRKHTGAQVRRDAEIALDHLRRVAEDAQALLDAYADVEHDTDALVARYRAAHGDPYNVSYGEWRDRAESMFARRREQVAAYQRVLHPATAAR